MDHTMSELSMLAQELAEPHLTRHGERIGKVPALLDELVEAISGATHEGGGSGGKQSVLVNTNALDLHADITKETWEAYTDRYGQSAPTLKTCIETIGRGEHPPEWDAWFTAHLRSIRDRIEQLLRPKKLRRLDGVQCPSCGQAVHGEERETALYLDCYTGPDKHLRHPSEWEVTCAACQATWDHQNMQWLLVALAGE